MNTKTELPMPIVGLEPTQTTPILEAGPTPSAAPPISRPEPTPVETVEVMQPMEVDKLRIGALTDEKKEQQLQGVAETFRRMGLNRKSVRKILEAGSKEKGYLNKRITGRIALVFFLDSAEAVAKAQALTLKAAEDAVDEKVKVAALVCTAQCGMAIGNLANYIEQNGDKYGELDGESKPKATPHTLVQVNNFPPVAQLPPPAA